MKWGIRLPFYCTASEFSTNWSKKGNRVSTNARAEVGLEIIFFVTYLITFRRPARFSWSISRNQDRMGFSLEFPNLCKNFREVPPNRIQRGDCDRNYGLPFCIRETCLSATGGRPHVCISFGCVPLWIWVERSPPSR